MESKKTKRGRVRLSRQEIAEHLKAFEGSGQSMVAYCAARGLSVSTFSNWRRRTRSKDSARLPDFIFYVPGLKPPPLGVHL